MDRNDLLLIIGRHLEKMDENFSIRREKAGVISEEAVWVCCCDGYLYMHETLAGLAQTLDTEWQHDDHLAM